MLNKIHHFETRDHTGTRRRRWMIYECRTCGGVVSAWAQNFGEPIMEYFPVSGGIDADVPERPRSFLLQAQESLHAPSGAVMLCASAVDAMLKIKGYASGSLYARIEQAVSDNLITAEMATWAHDIRLDANDQRHADEEANLPDLQDATRVLDFANALAEFLFVLPSRVRRGLQVHA
jgi:hypothetical protein